MAVDALTHLRGHGAERAGVAQPVLELRPGRSRADGNRDRNEPGGRDGPDDEFGAPGEEDSDPVPDPETGERRRERLGPDFDLPEGGASDEEGIVRVGRSAGG